MKYFLLLIALVLSFSLFGQNTSKKELEYKPKNIEESLIQLDKLFPDSVKNQIKIMSENDFITNTHFSTGMWIRNEWLYNRKFMGLIVTKSDLHQSLLSQNIFHNDDMSSLILRSYHRKLNNKEILLDEQIKNISSRYRNKEVPVLTTQE